MRVATPERAASPDHRPAPARRARPPARLRPSRVPVAGPREAALAAGLASPGVALEPGVRRVLERGLGSDLGDVRLHVGEAAGRSAAALGSAAFTVGRDIVFGAGRYAPERPSGLQLLAHELVHSLQQDRAPSWPAGDAAPGAEREACAAAARLVAGLAVTPPRRAGPPVLARQDEREPATVPPVSIPYGGGGRLTLIPGPGPLELAGTRLPLPGSLRLTNALGAGSGPSFVLDLDPRHLVLSLLDRVDLQTSTVEGTPPGREDDPAYQARLQLVHPVARLDFGSGRIDGWATLHVPSGYPTFLHPGTDVDVRVDSTLSDPMTWHVGAGYGPLTANATLRLHYDVGRLGDALASGWSELGRELAAPGLSVSGTARLFGLPITRYGLEAPTTRTRAHPLLGAPTPFPSRTWAAGVILAPPGSVTSVTAPALGFTGSSFGERSGFSLTAALLPTLSPEAISAGEDVASMFPVHAYAEVSYVNRVSDGLEVGIRAVAQINTAELAHPPHGLTPPAPGESGPAPDPLSRQLQPLPAPISPSATVTIFGRFNAL